MAPHNLQSPVGIMLKGSKGEGVLQETCDVPMPQNSCWSILIGRVALLFKELKVVNEAQITHLF